MIDSMVPQLNDAIAHRRRGQRLEVRQRCPRQLLQARHLRRGRLPARHRRVEGHPGRHRRRLPPRHHRATCSATPRRSARHCAPCSASRTPVRPTPARCTPAPAPRRCATRRSATATASSEHRRPRAPIRPDSTSPRTSPPISPAGNSRRSGHRQQLLGLRRLRGTQRSDAARAPHRFRRAARATPVRASARTAPAPCCGLPVWGDQAPVIEAQAAADVDGKAGDDLPTDKHRYSSAGAHGTTAFYAVATEGSDTVTGEIVVDLTAYTQSGGHDASAGTDVRSRRDQRDATRTSCNEDEYCSPSTRTTDRRRRALSRAQIPARPTASRRTAAVRARSTRFPVRRRRDAAWAGDQTIVDIDETTATRTRSVPRWARRSPSAVGSRRRTVRCDCRTRFRPVRSCWSRSAPPPRTASVRSARSTGPTSRAPAQGRITSRIGFAPDGTPVHWSPLAGFVAPAAGDTTAPTIDRHADRDRRQRTAGTAATSTSPWRRPTRTAVRVWPRSATPSTVACHRWSTPPTATVTVTGDGTHTSRTPPLTDRGTPARPERRRSRSTPPLR